MKLKDLVNINNPVGYRIGLFIQFLILLSIVTFSIGTLPNLSDHFQRVLRATEIFIVVIFSVEYLIRVFTSQKPLRFIFSFFGIIDLLAILPFYLSLGIDLRSLRAVRLLRLFRILKLARYSKAIDHFRRAILLSKGELGISLAAMILLLYFSAVGIYYFEKTAQPESFSSVFDSLWWSVATLTTVGYGDVYPVTVGGKVFTFFVLMIGLGIVAIPAGIFAAALSKTDVE